MAYSIFTPTGSQFAITPVTVPDNAINNRFYDSANKLGLQLVGRNAIDYGTAIAQNSVQLASNFAGIDPPSADISLQGQLWFNATGAAAGSLYVRTSTSASSEFPLGWQKVLTASSTAGDAVTVTTGTTLPGTGTDGDMFIRTSPTRISMWADGGWRQLFPAVYS